MSSSRELESFVHACTPLSPHPLNSVGHVPGAQQDVWSEYRNEEPQSSHPLMDTATSKCTLAHVHVASELLCVLLFWFTLRNKASFHLTLQEGTACTRMLQAGA